MRIWIAILSVLIALTVPSAFAAEKALILDINGAIGPATQDYIERGISQAKTDHDAAVIIQMDTPGGLDTSMRGINEAILTSTVPIITFVYPSGSRAASAGVFILYASHFAAMAPGTNVGAASPISLIGPTQAEGTRILSTEEKKMVNDTTAYIRGLAELRGRNRDWAALAVEQAESIPAEEAKELNVINVVASDYPSLLQQLNAKTTLINGITIKLNTNNLQLEHVQADWRYHFLSFITNPNIAYVLMLIAIYGIFFELANPGTIVPGAIGIISLLLILYAFQLMPINYVGLMLILVGIAFMIFEVYVSSFGLIGIGGVMAFIIGSVMLFDVRDANYHITWTLIFLMSTISFAFFLVILNLAFKSHKKSIVTGREGLIGAEGVVLSVMNKQTVVRVLGEIWEAKTPYMLNRGDKVRVTQVQGLILTVTPLEESKLNKSGD